MPATSIAVVRWNLLALELTLEEVAGAAGIELGDRTTVTYEDAVRLWEAAAEIRDDPHVGHRCGVRLRLHELGALGPLFSSATTLRDGLEKLVEVLPMVLPGTMTWTEQDGGGGVLVYRRPACEVFTRHGVEALLAGLISLARQCTRRPIQVARTTFSNPAPPDPTLFEEYYGGEIVWAAADCRLELDAEALDASMTGAHDELSRMIASQARSLVPAQSLADDVELRVAKAIRASLDSREPTLSGVARYLGTSQRTLQRQLEAAGLSFRDLRDRVLREQAEQLLGGSKLTIDEIAEYLGYASRTAFDRAFGRWANETPAAFRRGSSRSRHARTSRKP